VRSSSPSTIEEVGLAGEDVEPREIVAAVLGAGTGDSQGLAQQFLAVVSTIVEQVVKGRASVVLEVAGTGIGERLPDRVVVADLAERLVGGRHGDLAALGRGGLRREDRLSRSPPAALATNSSPLPS